RLFLRLRLDCLSGRLPWLATRSRRGRGLRGLLSRLGPGIIAPGGRDDDHRGRRNQEERDLASKSPGHEVDLPGRAVTPSSISLRGNDLERQWCGWDRVILLVDLERQDGLCGGRRRGRLRLGDDLEYERGRARGDRGRLGLQPGG